MPLILRSLALLTFVALSWIFNHKNMVAECNLQLTLTLPGLPKTWNSRVCLVHIFKTIFCSQNLGEQGKQGKYVWFIVFYGSEKHRKY